ncbi:MAG: FAD-dependent oxidoreductase [Acidimicrobiales bacterium]
MKDRHDVVVCGAGMAGLTAAVAAQDGGADVVVIEKGPSCGGSAVISNGFVWTHDSLDRVHELVPNGNPELQGIVVDNLDADMAWLATLGLRTGPKRQVLDYGSGWQVDPNEMIDTLRSTFERRGGDVLLDTPLRRFRSEGVDRIVDCGDGRTVRCGAVVVATGGFQGDGALVSAHCAPPGNLYHRSNPWSTGDGLAAATAIGGAVSRGMNHFYGHAMLAPPSRFGPRQFGEVTQYQGHFSVALDLDGVRFAVESRGTGEEVLNQSLAKRPGGTGVYIVDAAGAERFSLPPDLLKTSTVLERAHGYGAAATADDLDDLCDALSSWGVARERARRELARATEPEAGSAPALGAGPYSAVLVKAAITFTMGGLAVDETMRVLDRAASTSPLATLVDDFSQFRQRPIEWLFAAGCDVGDVSHDSYVGGLATALTTGRLAGAGAAASVAPSPIGANR